VNSTTITAGGQALPAGHELEDELLGHPKGLYVCFFTEMWERFSFYGMKALLLLYMLKHHLFSDDDGYGTLGAYAGMVYAVPVLGGLLADRVLGMRRAVVFGGILLCFGHLGMAWEGDAAQFVNGVVVRDSTALIAFYLSLSLIISGVGFLKPNIAAMVGVLYPVGDPRRDSGFTLYYAGINTGALFSSLICGYVGEVYGWRFGFGLAGIGMAAGLCVFLAGQRHLRGLAEAPDEALLQRRILGPIDLERAIYAGTLFFVVLVASLLHFPLLVGGLQVGVLVVWLVWFTWYVNARCDKVQRGRMVSILFFISFVLLFFTLYEQTYASWVTFTDRLLDKDLFPSIVLRDGKHLPWSIIPLALSPFVVVFALRARAGAAPAIALGLLALLSFAFIIRDSSVLPQTAGSLTYLGALFIVLLSPLFSWLWPFLARRGLNPSKTIKCSIGLALAGLCYLPLMWAARDSGSTGMGSVWWLALAYFVLEVGEVTLSPITLSAISELTMPKVAALMMSAWLLATSFAEWLAAQSSKLASLDIKPGEKIDAVLASAKYADLFQQMAILGLGSAAVALLCAPLLRRWMHGIR